MKEHIDSKQLYLCSLMTYGCLLRPHREIRELTWSDFSDDLKYIHLSGNRNKSGRNRIVPVPSYVREILTKGEPHHNIFSGRPQPLNQDYFKTLWSRFKRQSNTLEQGQTLYSFRHSGAIEIFKRTSYVREILTKGEPHHNIFSGRPQPLNQDYFKTLWSRFKRQSSTLEQGQTLYSFRHTGAIEIFKRTGSITKLQKAMGHSSINVSLTYLRGLEIAELREEDMPML